MMQLNRTIAVLLAGLIMAPSAFPADLRIGLAEASDARASATHRPARRSP